MSSRKRALSPAARADAGGPKASPSLLKYVLSKSRSSRIRKPSGTHKVIMGNNSIKMIDAELS